MKNILKLLNDSKSSHYSFSNTSPEKFSLTPLDLFQILEDKNVSPELIRVFDVNGEAIHPELYTSLVNTTVVNPLSLYRLYKTHNCSIVINSLDLYWNELFRFRAKMEAELQKYVEVNLYLTPGGNNQTFKWHKDSHDVFLIQISGEKQWCISNKTSGFDEFETLLLTKGNTLQIKKNFFHCAYTKDLESMHVTFGIYPPQLVLKENVTQRPRKLILKDYQDFIETSNIENVSFSLNSYALLEEETEDGSLISNRQHSFYISNDFLETWSYIKKNTSFKYSDLREYLNDDMLYNLLSDLFEYEIIHLKR